MTCTHDCNQGRDCDCVPDHVQRHLEQSLDKRRRQGWPIDMQPRPDMLREDYHAERGLDRAPSGAWIGYALAGGAIFVLFLLAQRVLHILGAQ